jgi:hypothetical protein
VKKLAIFVEGYTELKFVERLILEIAGRINVVIAKHQMSGHAMVRIEGHNEASDATFYVMILDCRGDTAVRDRIGEQHAGLSSAGYSKIIGIRDVRPDFERHEIPQLRLGLHKYLKTSLAPVTFILCEMEIEAWFLAETGHFPRVDAALTKEAVTAQLGFDPDVEDVCTRLNPTADLAAVYAMVGKEYRKGNIEALTQILDFEYIYCELKDRIPDLKRLCDDVDEFLAA